MLTYSEGEMGSQAEALKAVLDLLAPLNEPAKVPDQWELEQQVCAGIEKVKTTNDDAWISILASCADRMQGNALYAEAVDSINEAICNIQAIPYVRCRADDQYTEES